MSRRGEETRGAAEAEALAERAAERMLGPNPFIGLRARDLAETLRVMGAQALKQPGLVLEQEAAFARDLIAALAGNAHLAPEKGDRRFADGAWQETPSTGCISRATWRGAAPWADSWTRPRWTSAPGNASATWCRW